MQPSISRRQVLKLGTAALAAPTIISSSVFGQNAPSERVNLAVIGTGSKANGGMRNFMFRSSYTASCRRGFAPISARVRRCCAWTAPRIVAAMSRLTDRGVIISECSVRTDEGVKVADVAWASERFAERNKGSEPFEEAPEICIEILSPSNTRKEMDEKRELYFARGAEEFWTCNSEGNIRIFGRTGMIRKSNIIKKFPDKIILW